MKRGADLIEVRICLFFRLGKLMAERMITFPMTGRASERY
jgi:hypothetical protein